MPRLIDRLLGRAPSRRDIGGMDSAYSTWVSLYGLPDAERILPAYAQYAAEAYSGNSIVWSVILRRLTLFSEAEFRFQDRKTRKLSDSDALAKLETPWPNGSTGELLARMEQDVSLAGNAYIRDAGDRLERLRPDWVTIVSRIKEDALGRQTREIIGYLYEPMGDSARNAELFDVDEVAHWSPIPDPLANFRGVSWLTPVLREIDADIRMTAFRDAYFRNAATPNIVLKYQQRLGKDRIDRVRDMMAARHSGPDNAFRTLVLDEGADLSVVGHSMEGAAFESLQAVGELRIANAAGVPPLVVGLSEAIKAARQPGLYADAMRAFADVTMRPQWRTACVALSTLVEVPKGARLWYDTNGISALRPAESDAATTMSAQASTANTLIMAGYEPDSVTDAITAQDFSLLKHTGLTSVQLYTPGENNSDATPDNAPPDAGTQPDGGKPTEEPPADEPTAGKKPAKKPNAADDTPKGKAS
jgi:phage portal protein BeeE